MAANFESGFFVKEPAWHNLGIVLPEAPDWDQIAALSETDWKVYQSKLLIAAKAEEVAREMLCDRAVAQRIVDAFKSRQYGNLIDAIIDNVINPMTESKNLLADGVNMNLRDKDNAQLGHVGNRYEIFQNEQVIELLKAVGEYGFTPETAGSLNGGRTVFYLLKAEPMMLCGDEFTDYICVTNTHDGSGSVRVMATPTRVVCQNTLNLAMRDAKRTWKCKHTGNLMDKAEEARLTMLNTKQYMVALNEKFKQMDKLRLTEKDEQLIINQLIPINEEWNQAKKNRELERQEAFRDLYLHEDDLGNFGKTGLRMINAVSDYFTHSEPARRTDSWQENRFLDLVTNGNSAIDKANEIIESMLVEVA